MLGDGACLLEGLAFIFFYSGAIEFLKGKGKSLMFLGWIVEIEEREKLRGCF